MGLDVGVVGAGITGLSAAINVLKLIRGVNVTIIADRFGKDTITPVTRSLFVPVPSCVTGVDKDTVLDWYRDGWDHHFTRAKMSVGEESGHSLMTGYYLWSDGEDPVFAEAVYGYKKLSEAEILEEDFPYKYGCQFTTVKVDFNKYLGWLMKTFREMGGKLQMEIVYSLQELYGKFDVVINCTGMRAREQVADPLLAPIKGHVARVRTQQINNFLIAQDDDISIVPCSGEGGCVDVGYTWEYATYRPGVTRDMSKILLQKARDLVPSLENCGVKKIWSEKRPHREPPLVEVELVSCSGPILPVVHNVGLGKDSLSMAWGTGVYVAHLVQDLSRTIKPFAKVMLPFKTLI